jgi:hypothetical protein
VTKKNSRPVISKVLGEEFQEPGTRRQLLVDLEEELKRPIISFFTSFRYPVMIEDKDVDILEGILQKMDLSKGICLVINSPGGDGLSAERIINLCRSYSKTGEYWAIVPGKAKSATTMICFGASKIIMGPVSELGPIDPQFTTYEEGMPKWFSVYNIVKSYEGLFRRAVKEKGNLEPYLQQLAKYDEREIKECKAALSLSEDIAIQTLASGMMKKFSKDKIKKRIKIFLTPERTKTHGRPIYRDEARRCGLNIDSRDVNSKVWEVIYELYIRTDNFVSEKASKTIESKDNSFFAVPPKGEKK